MLPENVDFGAEVLSNYSRNTFRIEPNSSTSATAGRVIQITLPENSVLDMKSLRMFMKVTTTKGVATGPHDVLALLPANIEGLISSIEVYVNGVQVAQGSNEYNTICKVVKLGAYNQDAQLSSGTLVNHSRMVASLSGVTTPADAVEIFGATQSGNGENGDVCIDNWCNFLGTTATRFIPTDVLGSITIKITLASDAVLSGAILGKDTEDPSLNSMVSNPSYKIENPYFTIDSCVLPEAYNELLRRRLMQDEFLPLNYTEYYTFINSGITGSSYSNRFALSSGCINSLHAVQRLDSHNIFGAATNLAPETGARSPLSATGASHEGKFFTYKTFKASADYDDGIFKYQFNINNVNMPQFLATNKFAMANLPYVNNKLTPKTQGILVAGETAFCQGQAIYGCQLSHPDLSSKVMSGLNSRGINSQFYFTAQGLDTTQIASGMSSVVIASTTAQLRISAGRQVSVIW
tara:strand:+ start:1583 stop:2974 length:1392 start_codon:yes stop_codon:yes gene_type:complete